MQTLCRSPVGRKVAAVNKRMLHVVFDVDVIEKATIWQCLQAMAQAYCLVPVWLQVDTFTAFPTI